MTPVPSSLPYPIFKSNCSVTMAESEGLGGQFGSINNCPPRHLAWLNRSLGNIHRRRFKLQGLCGRLTNICHTKTNE